MGFLGSAPFLPAGSILSRIAEKLELSRGGGVNNIRSMEGLRGFAVLLVFLTHYSSMTGAWLSVDSAVLTFTSFLHAIGSAGVDLFFVLSGYLIYGSLMTRQQTFVRFMSRRIVRIYPAFTAVFVVYIVLSFTFPTESKIPGSPGDGALYLLQNFLLLPGFFPITPMITVAWSLSYEIFFYAAMPWAIVLLNMRQRGLAWRVIFFAAVALGAVTYSAANGGHVRLIMFIAGILLYEATNRKRTSSMNGAYGAFALIIGLSGMLLPMEGPAGDALKASILFAAFFSLCFVCFTNPLSIVARHFSWAPLRWLGNMSYSYYLSHTLALKVGFFLAAAWLPIGNYGIWLFLGLAASHVCLDARSCDGTFPDS